MSHIKITSLDPHCLDDIGFIKITSLKNRLSALKAWFITDEPPSQDTRKTQTEAV